MRKQIGSLLAAAMLGAVALAIIAPGAQSNSSPRISLKTVVKETTVPNGKEKVVFAKCPRGYHVVGDGGGATEFLLGPAQPNVTTLLLTKTAPRTVHAGFANTSGQPQKAGVSAICAAGGGGLRISG